MTNRDRDCETELAAHIRELEAENARLVAAAGAAGRS